MKFNGPIILILLISLLSMNFRCGKEVEPRPFDQDFLVPVDIFPLKKIYSLTDTIWIESDITGKNLFNLKTNQLIFADTGRISFGASLNRFGTSITNPPDGFADVITINGVNVNRLPGHWSTGGSVDNFGCGQPSYRLRIGFKPNYKGTYGLQLNRQLMLESCSNKLIPWYASLAYQYKNVDLNLDVFNSLSNHDKGGKDGIKFYTSRISNRELFVFRVE